MQCVECNGSGRTSCGACWNGNLKSLCPECNGRGTLQAADGATATCGRCGGEGRFVPPSCPICGNSTPCGHCGGSGQVQ